MPNRLALLSSATFRGSQRPGSGAASEGSCGDHHERPEADQIVVYCSPPNHPAWQPTPPGVPHVSLAPVRSTSLTCNPHRRGRRAPGAKGTCGGNTEPASIFRAAAAGEDACVMPSPAAPAPPCGPARSACRPCRQCTVHRHRITTSIPLLANISRNRASSFSGLGSAVPSRRTNPITRG